MQHIPQIAIACQGGGSQTAFTAGVLKTLVRRAAAGDFQITALSGTSGGAICAALAWYGLQQQQRGAWSAEQTAALLDEFWRDNSALLPGEVLWNESLVQLARQQDRGLVPQVQLSPYATPVALGVEVLQALAPRREFVDLRFLLEKYLPFDELPAQTEPRLWIGAIEVLSGTFTAFDSARGEISVETILASAALPTLFPAVEVGAGFYWDGLFSQNPPVREFLHDRALANKPDEIWVVAINPQRRADVPTTTLDIEDRRNELSGNLSLNQELFFVQTVNEWLARGILQDPTKKHVAVKEIALTAELSARLDTASKLDRGRLHIKKLISDGERQAERFLAAQSWRQ